jgi:dTDP-4-dehydrorhamnose reductase
MRAYVTGGTGFVGSNIVKVFADAHGATVHCPVHRYVPSGSLPYTTEPLDLLDAASVEVSVRRFAPDVVVHSMILNDFGQMYADRNLAWRSYVGVTKTLADVCRATGARLILVSTDWVFDGTQVGADEETPPNPVNYYGVLKMASEQVALLRTEGSAVARVSGVNGTNWARPRNPRSQDPGFGYFVASLVDALARGRVFEVWEADDINMVATPSLASECAELMWCMATNENASGIFHCCGADATTRMELAELACSVFELDRELLRSAAPDSSAMPGAPIPYDTSLSVGRTSEILGRQPLSAAEILGRFRQEQETGEIATGGRR